MDLRSSHRFHLLPLFAIRSWMQFDASFAREHVLIRLNMFRALTDILP